MRIGKRMKSGSKAPHLTAKAGGVTRISSGRRISPVASITSPKLLLIMMQVKTLLKTLMRTYLPWMLHLLKVMMFCVRVPVLSEKMYWICPSSSFSVVVLRDNRHARPLQLSKKKRPVE